MKTAFRDMSTIDILLAQVAVVEHDGPLPSCSYDKSDALATGATTGPCNSLAQFICDKCGEECEFHAIICLLEGHTIEQRGRRVQ
jgi:hypothetical protein